SRRRHTRFSRDWSSDVCSSDLSEVKPNQVGSFRSLAEKWLNHSEKVREISQSCLMNYRCHLKHHIFPVIGDMFLKDLTLHSIERSEERRVGKECRTGRSGYE